jgi:NADH-quinone oxidoreductase subunit E
MGTACHIRGAGQLVEELERQLGIGPDETTEDMKFTVKTVNCVGACAMAPVLIVGEKYWGSAKSARMAKYLAEGADDEN